MRKVIFRLEQGNKEGQEKTPEKKRKYNVYKKRLIKDGEEIISEKETTIKRLGKVMILKLK